jgi:arginase family enzyme
MSDPKSTYVTPPFAGIATFGRQPYTRDLTGVDVAIVGVPYDSATSYRSGTRLKS